MARIKISIDFDDLPNQEDLEFRRYVAQQIVREFSDTVDIGTNDIRNISFLLSHEDIPDRILWGLFKANKKSFEDIYKMTKEDILALDGVGKVTADKFICLLEKHKKRIGYHATRETV